MSGHRSGTDKIAGLCPRGVLGKALKMQRRPRKSSGRTATVRAKWQGHRDWPVKSNSNGRGRGGPVKVAGCRPNKKRLPKTDSRLDIHAFFLFLPALVCFHACSRAFSAPRSGLHLIVQQLDRRHFHQPCRIGLQNLPDEGDGHRVPCLQVLRGEVRVPPSHRRILLQ